MSQKIYFTPGPSHPFYTFQDHLKQAIKEDIISISHRGQQFKNTYQHTIEQLKALLNLPDGYQIVFTSSANEIWERIIQNLVKESSHHFVNGSFSKKFFSFTQDYQLNSTNSQVEDGETFIDWSVPDSAELVSLTLNETSIGYQLEEGEVGNVRANYPEKLIALDVVSAFPGTMIDIKLVDTAYFSVQKCFGLPSGLGVWIFNERCLEKHRQLESANHVTGSFHKLSTLSEMGLKYQTPETPNTLAIYLLGKIAEDMLRRGVSLIQNETKYKSAILYGALERKGISPFIRSVNHRSKTVIVAETGNRTEQLIEAALTKQWVVGSGYGKYKGEHIRIANFPTHSKEQFEQLADFIENL